MALDKLSTDMITDSAITAAKIADGTVVAAEIADGAITDAKISAVAATKLTGTIADARFPATLPASSGVNLTSIPAGNLTGTVADARISTLTASKLTGALPAISGAALTGVGVAGITSSANATAITISANEEVTLNSQPACLANCNGGLTDKTGDGTTYTVPWGQQRYNVGNDLYGTTFTASITGKYLICSSVFIAYANAGPDGYGSNIVTTKRTYGWKNSSYLQTDFVSWSDLSMKNAVVADMDAGDTAYITVRISGMTKTVDLETGNGYDYFSVILLA